MTDKELYKCLKDIEKNINDKFEMLNNKIKSWDDANYINCMVGEIQKYPEADNVQSSIAASLPSTELYRWNFASPVWAPTLTGFMILITIVIIVVILIRGIWWIILRLSLLFI